MIEAAWTAEAAAEQHEADRAVQEFGAAQLGVIPLARRGLAGGWHRADQHAPARSGTRCASGPMVSYPCRSQSGQGVGGHFMLHHGGEDGGLVRLGIAMERGDLPAASGARAWCRPRDVVGSRLVGGEGLEPPTFCV